MRSKSEPGGTLYRSGICELASDKRYICVRINYQAGSFSRQSKSRHDRRLSLEKLGMHGPANQNFNGDMKYINWNFAKRKINC